MKKTTLYLTAEQDAKIKSLAEAAGISQADLIRRAIDAYASPRRPEPMFIGVGRGPGGGSVADHKREWLRGFGQR
jgi:hypothetical protein